MRDTIEIRDQWAAEDKTSAVATVVAARGSTPRPVGSRFLVSASDDVFGSVSGGCVETDVARHAGEVLAGGGARLVTYGIAADDAFEVGLACGGSIDVFVQPADALDGVAEFLDAGRYGTLVTVVRGPDTGSGMLCDATGSPVCGDLPDGALEAVGGEIERVIGVEGSAIVEVGERTVFVEWVGGGPRLVIVGATNIGAALSVIARETGFRVTVVDPREAFAVPERFPAAERVLRAWPDAVFDELGVDERTHVVVLSHDEKIEGPLLPLLLGSPARYLGVMGSRRTHAARLERLRAQGWGDRDVARLHGPVGLDIGGQSAGEMAVGIVSEMTLARRRPDIDYGRSIETAIPA